VKRPRTDDGHTYIAGGDTQFVESTCRRERGPQASKAGSENNDIFHGRTLPICTSSISHSKPRKREWTGCRMGLKI
jgi:hypothetical protein